MPLKKVMEIEKLFNVRDKVILVTGGSRGIGYMIAKGFVRNGARVYITARSAKVCDEQALRLHDVGPGTCVSVPADLQHQAEITRLVDVITAREGQLDVLVNNAGANWGAPLAEYPEGAFDKVLELNVKSVFALTKQCLPLLEAAKGARVINIGSVDGLRVPALETYAYSASKAALHHLTRHMASQMAALQITVNAVAPGPFESKMMDATLKQYGDIIQAGIPLQRIGVEEDMAGVCLYLASTAGAYVTGAVIPVDGGSLVASRM
jgi:NAD(P)-dependent dehydrogenase (short-subunit alcohol dehydrogenase family)